MTARKVTVLIPVRRGPDGGYLSLDEAAVDAQHLEVRVKTFEAHFPSSAKERPIDGVIRLEAVEVLDWPIPKPKKAK